MSQVLFSACAAFLAVGAVSWELAAYRVLDRSRALRDTEDPDAERIVRLARRDALVGALFGLVGLAAAARAVAGINDGADWFLALAVVPAAASLPYLERYQGTVELDRTHHQRQDQTRLELLYEVAAAGEVLDVEVSAQRMARALAPALGDWSVVALLDRHGEIEGLAVAQGDDDPDAARALEEILADYPVSLDADEGLGRAIRSGAAVRYETVPDELLASVAEDDRHLDLLHALGMRSVAIEPVADQGVPLGAVAILSRRSTGIDDAQLELLHAAAAQAAPVLANARLHRDLQATEAALRFSEAVLRAQGESGVEGLMVVSPEGEMMSYNSRFVEMWGFDQDLLARGADDEALTEAMTKLVDPEAFRTRVEAVYADPSAPCRDEVHFLDGRVFDRYGAPLTADDGAYLGWAWYFRDVTDERRAQRSLQESSERFAAVARTLQESLLPPDLPHIDGVELAARYHPAGDGSEIGGDFYDVFPVSDDEWCAVLGDVCGKGAAAARLTAMIRYTFRATAARSRRLERNLTDLNSAMLRQGERDRHRNEQRFATAAGVRIRADEGTVELAVASAGHPLPLVVHADGTVTEVDCRGHLLGMFDEVIFRPTRTTLHTGEAMVLYTDGVTEARQGRDEFGEERLRRLLSGLAGASAATITAAIESAVLEFQGGTARDDIAVLVLRAPDTGNASTAAP